MALSRVPGAGELRREEAGWCAHWRREGQQAPLRADGAGAGGLKGRREAEACWPGLGLQLLPSARNKSRWRREVGSLGRLCRASPQRAQPGQPGHQVWPCPLDIRARTPTPSTQRNGGAVFHWVTISLLGVTTRAGPTAGRPGQERCAFSAGPFLGARGPLGSDRDLSGGRYRLSVEVSSVGPGLLPAWCGCGCRWAPGGAVAGGLQEPHSCAPGGTQEGSSV